MASVAWTVQHPSGAQAVMTTDADQVMPVPGFVDPSGQKRAGDVVAGDSVRSSGVVWTVISVDVPEV